MTHVHMCSHLHDLNNQNAFCFAGLAEHMCCAASVDLLASVKMKCYATVLPNVPIEISSLSPFRRWLSSTDKEIMKHEVNTSPG